MTRREPELTVFLQSLARLAARGTEPERAELFGATPRYVRLRPQRSVSAILDGTNDQTLADGVNRFIAKTTVEILTLRPTMSLGLETK